MAETRGKTNRRRFTVDALFSDTSARGVGVEVLPEARLIRLERVEPDPTQPRRTFDLDRLEELAASIRSEGILQPIAVRYDDARNTYVIVHGERRWRAAGMAGLAAIPAIVRDVPEDRRLLQQLMENVVREDLNALDRAAALRTLKEQMGNPSWDRVAEAVGIRRSRLFQLLDTEKLEATIQEALRRGLVSEKQTRALHRLLPELQAELGERVLAGDIQPRDLQEAARVAAGATTLDAARGVLDDVAQVDRPDFSSTATVRTITRRAAALAETLHALDVASLDKGLRAGVAQTLREIREQLDATILRLDS
jgi:ParB family chromosome partitioning protein